MNFLSTFSGIEAASVAWAPLGWEALAFAEIDPFCRALLAHRFPDVPNLGDVKKWKDWPDGFGERAVDLVCGGTPCQSFSIAGLRGGLADPRGNLALTFLAIVDRYRPRWVVWENVPGVLSDDEGRSFAAILAGLGKLGYGWCYRVLDAQYVRVDGFPCAVPQRRRRVFLVGYLGDWRRAAAVLSERQSLQGHLAPRRTAGKGVAAGVAPSLAGSGRGVARAGESCGQDPLIPEISNALAARDAKQPRAEDNVGLIVVPVAPTMMAADNNTGGERPYGTYGDSWDGLVAHTLRGEGFDAMEDGTGRGLPLVAQPLVARSSRGQGQTNSPGFHADGNLVALPFAFQESQSGFRGGDVHASLDANNGSRRHNGVAIAIQERAVSENPDNGPAGKGWRDDGAAYTVEARNPQAVAQQWAVRRLMPVECERLMGFPDGWTDVPYRGKPHAADGPRYRALGNSWAVNCVRWIGMRIDMVERLAAEIERREAV